MSYSGKQFEQNFKDSFKGSPYDKGLMRLFDVTSGYTVHPVPAPASTIEDASSNRKDGGSSQKLMLFIRGKAISGAPIISGTSQLPKPPIIMGITIKKIITKA